MTYNESIHPRVVNGRAFGSASNTCIPPTKAKRERLIAALKRRIKEHPNDKKAEARLKSLTNGKAVT